MFYLSDFPSQTRFSDSNHGHDLPYLIAVEVPLPSGEVIYNEAMALAWPQVLAFSTAIVGILSIIYIIRSFTR